MIVEQIYLENSTTRKAFYHVKLVKDEGLKLPYRVEVQWGRLGTEGRTTVKKRSHGVDAARMEMHKLAEAKKLRHYKEAKKPQVTKTTTEPKILKDIPPDAQRFLSLELE
jgi:predicted DNA-binding WGR domain protein